MELKVLNKIDPHDVEKLTTLIEADLLDRNTHLTNLINIFTITKNSLVLGIDGRWGTGKTIFLKQLELLINSETKYSDFQIDEVRNKFRAFYFSSWENDLYGSPLVLLLFSLSKKFAETNYPVDTLVDMINDLEEISRNSSQSRNKPLRDVLTVDQIKEKIFDLLSEITKEKELLIIIDELDRCKPTYAIELLEVIKHYFYHHKVSLILCSNKIELSNTVKKYYGNNFNGYDYLDRFMDLEYILPEPNVDKYLEEVLRRQSGNYVYVIEDISNYFNLSMRQVNKYLITTDLISSSSRNISSADIVFLYYAAALKMKDINKFNSFIEGDNFEEFWNYIKKADTDVSFLVRSSQELEIDEVRKLYNNSFSIERGDDRTLYRRNRMLRALSFIG